MDCPKCEYERVPVDARYCPGCGYPLEITARFDQYKIIQNVKHNAGHVIGVQTEAIHGNVYGGDIYEVQVYALGGAERQANWHDFLKRNTQPYKFLSPYTARERALFKGRDAEINQVIRQISEQRVLVVHGQAGVGLTSLLAAGVIPTLMEFGALVVRVQDYLQPVKAIRAAFAANAGKVAIALPDELMLPALIHAVEETVHGTLILVLDQFERLFEPSVDSERRTVIIEGLAESLQAVEPEFLRLIIAVQEDALKHMGELQDRLPDLLRSPFQLLPLSHRQAQAAIKDPLKELGYPVSYIGDLVDELLVPDLDDLTPEAPGLIHPPYLQVVSHWLYQAARDRDPPHIDTALYIKEAKSADGIMARYLEETLRTQLAGQQALAKRVMAAMLFPDARRWMLPEQLPSNGTPPKRIQDVLESLVKTALLISRSVNGRREYAFASPSVAREIRRLAGPEVERRYQAGDELEHIWRAWLARDAIATRGQLRHLAEAGAHLMPEAVKALLLLRSAVAQDEPAAPWLAWLRSDEGRALIRQLEEPAAAELTLHSRRSALNKAALLLGLADVALPNLPGKGPRPFGPVAWSSVSHPEPIARQTAALALMGMGGHETLNRLDWALQAGFQGWRRRERRAELRGTLADADPEMEQLNSDLPLLDRVWVWLWRVRRRLWRDRRRIAGLTLGGAIGAALGLGLLRMVIGGLARKLWGVQFAMYFWWAWILGAALALGMALAELLLLGRAEETHETPAIWQAPLHPDRLPALLGAGLGTLLFGMAHVIVTWFNGVSLHMERLGMGLVAGLGLSVALYAQPRAGWHLGIMRWLLRLGTAALAFFLTQWLFVVTGNKESALAIGWAGSFYKAEFTRYVTAWWPHLPEQFPRWFDYLALMDATLVGLVLAIGTTAGLLLGEDWLKRWRDLANRAGD